MFQVKAQARFFFFPTKTYRVGEVGNGQAAILIEKELVTPKNKGVTLADGERQPFPAREQKENLCGEAKKAPTEGV